MAEPSGNAGTFNLRNGGKDVSLWITEDQGEHRIVRQTEDGTTTLTERGNARVLDNGVLLVFFEARDGVSDILNGGSTKPGAAAYFVSGSFIYGRYRSGEGAISNERGRRVADTPVPEEEPTDDADDDADDTDPDTDPDDDADDDADDDDTNDPPPISGDVRVDAPLNGHVVLAGSTLAVELAPSNAELQIEGPASMSDAGLKIEGAGEIKLSAKLGDKVSQEITITAVECEVTQVKVTPFVKLGNAPQFKRDLGSDAEAKAGEPAVIQQGKPLEVEVVIQASASLSEAATIAIAASSTTGLSFTGEAEVKNLAAGVAVKLTSAEVLNEAVAINEVELNWGVAGRDAGVSPMRVYTTHLPPRKNIRQDRQPVATALHFEKACDWANGASQNIGQGADSIPHAVDNLFRHYVHPEDQGDLEIAVPDYASGAEKPVNYDDLSGSISSSTGKRSVSSLYYPPLKPTEDYQEYKHYRSNFGWHLLDNPTHTGGRCNQQAALVASILGTLGIEARIHYLERTGRGKTSGRPMRNYWYAAGGGGPWNFHGVAAVKLADGTEHLYDGSFSFPSQSYAQWGGRKNGSLEWAENQGGPFIQGFRDDDGEIWYYEDFGGRVPVSDIPEDSALRGIPRSDNDKAKLAEDRAAAAAVASNGNN